MILHLQGPSWETVQTVTTYHGVHVQEVFVRTNCKAPSHGTGAENKHFNKLKNIGISVIKYVQSWLNQHLKTWILPKDGHQEIKMSQKVLGTDCFLKKTSNLCRSLGIKHFKNFIPKNMVFKFIGIDSWLYTVYQLWSVIG